MAWLDKVVRPEFLNFRPFRLLARNPNFEGRQVQLDANENPWPPFGVDTDINRYPEVQSPRLKNRLADIYQVKPEEILITRGVLESIDLLVRTFCVPYQDAVAIMPPTFEYYNTAAEINSANLIAVPLCDEFVPDWDALTKLEHVKVIFLCTPNNPSGTVVPLNKIRLLCQHYHERAIIVVDEAYIEFADAISATTLLHEYSNLVVTRTLSKAYSLAGTRMGVTIAQADVINVLAGIIAPYSVPTPCTEIAIKALSPEGFADAKDRIVAIKKERDRLYEKLLSSKNIVKVYPSQANFLLAIVKDADAFYDQLSSKGILVRDFNRNKAIPGGLRITVGTPQDNNLLLSAFGVS